MTTTQGVKSNQQSRGKQDGRAPGELSILELARRCSEETSCFLKSGTSDGRYCLELFRRAVVRRDEDAWGCLYQQYAPLVLTWVQQHQRAAPLVAEEGAASLVNAAFAKFARAMTPAKMEGFDLIEAVLKYLKLCVRSVVADAVRARQARPCEEPLEVGTCEQASEDPAEGVVASLAVQRLWRAVQFLLHGEEEQAVIYCTYVLGLKPAEITTLYCRLFKSVEDVYRIKRNVLERLRRNADLQGYYAHGKEDMR